MEHFFHAVINMELVSYMMTKDTIKNDPCRLCCLSDPNKTTPKESIKQCQQDGTAKSATLDSFDLAIFLFFW